MFTIIFTYVAIYFLFWWLALFIALPFGLRTQSENEEITLGTVASAPGRPHLLKSVLLATAISTFLFAVYLFVTRYLGLTLNDVPNFIPEFK